MGDIVTKSAPYLYPFLIEFSLIGAAVLMVMWARIGKNPRYKYHDAIFVIRHRLQDNPFKQLTKSLIRNILDSGVMMTVTEFLLLRGKWSPTQGLIVLGLAKGFSLGFWFLSQHWYVSFSSLFWSIMENFMSHNLLSSSPTSATLPLWFSLFLQYYWDFAGEIWEKSKNINQKHNRRIRQTLRMFDIWAASEFDRHPKFRRLCGSLCRFLSSHCFYFRIRQMKFHGEDDSVLTDILLKVWKLLDCLAGHICHLVFWGNGNWHGVKKVSQR